MSAKTSDRPTSGRVGPYRIEQKLAEGGMGAVYRAWDERLKRPVAVKHILPEVDDPLLRERFRREAQAAASLNHSSIVHIYDIVEDDKGDWIVMELVEGKRLDVVLRRGALELNHAMRFAREIARGLAEAHAKGIIHRDLKAENVMVTRDGHAKILDFGLAKLAHDLQDPDLSTTQGTVLGTARVMSPEQAMGLGVDQRSDLFSLGTLLYEVFTGASPFKADAVVETLKRVCTLRQQHATHLREEIPEEMSELIDHLLEKDPEKRPRNAREVIAALVRISETHLPESMDEPHSGVSIRLDSSDDDGVMTAMGREESAPEPAEPHDSTTAAHRPFATRGAAVRPVPEPPDSRPDRGESSAPQSGGGSQSETATNEAEEYAASRSVSKTWALDATAPAFTRFRPAGERRQVTVLCCDLLSESLESSCGAVLDPEALFDVMPDFHTLADDCVGRFGGRVGKVLGHRLWAWFGYPQAHEDDAERAVRAALELVARARRLGFTSHAEPESSEAYGTLGVRVGIHTGPAVVAPESSSHDEIALGPTFEQATAVHEVASLHSVAVSRQTHRLIHETVATEPMASGTLPRTGPAGLTGNGTPYRVVALTDPRRRLEGAVGLVPLVGRRDELALLTGLWDRVRRGTGQVSFVSGEAGIGKTRLVQALKERLKSDATPWWIGVGSAFTRNSPLWPMAELLRGLLETVSGSSLTERLEATLEAHGFSLPECVPLFADLLNLPLGGRYDPLTSTAARQRARSLEALIALILEKAERRPAVMVVEDLQWVDPSSLELLDLLLDQVPAAPLLLILTYRSDFEVPWPPRSDVHYLSLEPLDDAEGRALVTSVAGAQAMPGPIREKILARADGVPLFLEEMTRSLLESDRSYGADPSSGVTPSTQILIPATLRDSLTARLDLLSSAKPLVQRAAVIGREFTADLLRVVSRFDPARFDEELGRLIDSSLVRPAPSPARGRYVFKSALIQKLAYRSLLKRERQEIHLAVAQALESGVDEAVRTGDGEVPYEVLARHYTRARRPTKAVDYWLEAGREALDRCANVEAVEHLRRGLTLLGALAPGRRRDAVELSLECALVPALAAVEGQAAPEVRQVMDRAYALTHKAGDEPGTFWAIWSLWTHYLMRGDSVRARQLAFELLRLGTAKRTLELHASYAVGYTLYSRGEITGAEEMLEKAVALDETGRVFSDLLQAGQEVGLGTRSVLALTLWHSGSPERALELSSTTLDAARRLGHPYSLAFALQAHAWLLLYQGDADAAFQRSQELVAHCREQDLWLAPVANFLLECARTRIQLRTPAEEKASAEELIEGLEKALQGVLAGGVGLGLTAFLCLAAEYCLRLGRPSECRRLLDRAEDLVAEEDQVRTSELLRVRGQLVLVGDEVDLSARHDRAEECFERSLALARERGDVSSALRTATALADLRHRQGRSEEARELLARALEDVGGGAGSADRRAAVETLAALNG